MRASRPRQHAAYIATWEISGLRKRVVENVLDGGDGSRYFGTDQSGRSCVTELVQDGHPTDLHRDGRAYRERRCASRSAGQTMGADRRSPASAQLCAAFARLEPHNVSVVPGAAVARIEQTPLMGVEPMIDLLPLSGSIEALKM